MGPLSSPADFEGQPLDKILKAARLCGHVGQTVVICQRADGHIYCNFQENNGCDENTDSCRLHDAKAEQAPA